MGDRVFTFSITSAVASILWALSVALLVVALAFGAAEIETVAIIAAIAAGTVTMRSYFVAQNRIIRGYAKLTLDNGPQGANLSPLR